MATETRAKRPCFLGQRFVVHDWMLGTEEEPGLLRRLLGAHFDAFDIHEWFFELDARTVQNGDVVPQRDGGAWLVTQTQREAQRRGLPVSAVAPIHHPWRAEGGYAPWECSHTPKCGNRATCAIVSARQTG